MKEVLMQKLTNRHLAICVRSDRQLYCQKENLRCAVQYVKSGTGAKNAVNNICSQTEDQFPCRKHIRNISATPWILSATIQALITEKNRTLMIHCIGYTGLSQPFCPVIILAYKICTVHGIWLGSAICIHESQFWSLEVNQEQSTD